MRLVQFFWDNAPWDRDGNVITQFTSPMMFEDCLRDDESRDWSNYRSRRVLRPDQDP